MEHALNGRTQMLRYVIGGLEWERLWILALDWRREFDSLRQLDDPPLRHPEQLLHLAPRHLLGLSLCSQPCSCIGIGGREGGLNLAGNVELAFEEAGRIASEVVERVWCLL